MLACADFDQAEATLRDAGFRVDRKQQDVTDPAQDGIVLSQDPSGSAKPGDRVTIVVGRLEGGGGGGGLPDGPGDNSDSEG